ncbi:MAG TPA: OmpA family protein, partial [Saprospiraceae bacterium]|nr:OmpA family protein [Saprospiraceae bacterium]
ERFSNLLAGDEDPIGKSFSFANLTFDTGSANISGSSKTEVENFAKVMNAYSTIKVEVQGHTDNTGDAAKNKTLSQARADAVKAMLMNLGVSGDRITTNGYGADNPTASNDTAEGRKQNRRIEVKITAK